jgi:hypothetical protein
MSYAVQPPAVAEAPRRPVTVGVAAVLLSVMGLGGLGYAVATLAVLPTVIDRFRTATATSDSASVDSLITVAWVSAGIATVLAVILFALYLVLALGLRRGSNASRIGVWVLSGLGLLAGCGTTVTVLVERSGNGVAGSLGGTLSAAYPGGWIGLNIALAIAQTVGYIVVAVLLVVSPAAFFGRAPTAAATPTYGNIRAYGAPAPYGYGQPGYPPPPSGYQPPSGYAAPAGPAAPAPAPGPYPPVTPQPGPDDEYWSRPSA